MTIISNEGAGISQAIGTGGRDVKEAIGGIMFIDAMRALAADPATKVIVLVSKPPHESVLRKIADEIKTIKKPVVGIFIGGDPKILEAAGAIAGSTLEETAVIAAALSKGPASMIAKEDRGPQGWHHRAGQSPRAQMPREVLARSFSGGTLCDETQLICKDMIGYINSNVPLTPNTVRDLWKSVGHTIIDLGEDEFTSAGPTR